MYVQYVELTNAYWTSYSSESFRRNPPPSPSSLNNTTTTGCNWTLVGRHALTWYTVPYTVPTLDSIKLKEEAKIAPNAHLATTGAVSPCCPHLHSRSFSHCTVFTLSTTSTSTFYIVTFGSLSFTEERYMGVAGWLLAWWCKGSAVAHLLPQHRIDSL